MPGMRTIKARTCSTGLSCPNDWGFERGLTDSVPIESHEYGFTQTDVDVHTVIWQANVGGQFEPHPGHVHPLRWERPGRGYNLELNARRSRRYRHHLYAK